jgi:hypothetical protein
MKLLKGLIGKDHRQKMPGALDDDLVPRLVPKPDQRKKKNRVIPKPLAWYIPIEIFPEPELPNIILWPPKPPESGPKVEDILFERSGSIFILRRL